MTHQQEPQKQFAARWFEEVWNQEGRLGGGRVVEVISEAIAIGFDTDGDLGIQRYTKDTKETKDTKGKPSLHLSVLGFLGVLCVYHPRER